MFMVDDGEAINTLCWMWKMLIEAQIKDVHGIIFFFLNDIASFLNKKIEKMLEFCFPSINSTIF
jgi:hypothetical protein